MGNFVTKQEWWKSKVFWKSIFAMMAILARKFFNTSFSDDEIDAVVDGTLNIIEIALWLYIVRGIRNNPSLKEEL